MPPFRTDIVDSIGGEAVIYVRDCLTCNRHADLKIRSVEAVWVEFYVKKILKKIVGDFFERPNCFMDYIALIKESYTRACNTKISNVNITGYFNFNMAQYVPNKMSELILEYYHMTSRVGVKYHHVIKSIKH